MRGCAFCGSEWQLITIIGKFHKSNLNGQKSTKILMISFSRQTNVPSLDDPTPVRDDEVEKMISAAANKTSQLDPAPTWLIKDVHGLLTSFITISFSKSLSTSTFPDEFRQAIICPLLKKTGLDASKLKNHRPVSNLSFLSKLWRVVQFHVLAFYDTK